MGIGVLYQWGASAMIGVTTYMLVSPLISDLLGNADFNRDQWDRNHARWQRLRAESDIFRIGQRWIVAVASVVSIRLSWLIHASTPANSLDRIVGRIVRVVFGSPEKLNRAARTLKYIEPWSPAESVAAGLLLGIWVACTICLTIWSMVNTWILAACCLVGGVLAMRLWVTGFIRRAARQRAEIRELLPHAIDAIAMVMNAGGTFGRGIDVVVADFPAHPLSQVLMRVQSSLGRGQTMREALADAAETICLPEFDEMARVLGRVHGHGVPGAEVFSRMAKQLRIARLRHMEEEVGKSEAAMSLPTMLVMLACMLVCVSPFVLSMLESDLLD